MTNEALIDRMKAAVSGGSRRDIHANLVGAIEAAIAEKILSPGDLLPGERDLCAELGVSRNVIRRTFATLEAEGILTTRHGLGTFVPKSLRKSTNSILGFSEEMARRGLIVESHTVSLIRRGPAAQEVIDLGLSPDDELVEIVRVRLADGTPIAHESALVPTWAISESFDGTTSLYAEMDARGTRPVRVLQEISARAANASVASSLEVPPGSPVLTITRKGLDKGNLVSELTVSHFRSDRYTWITELKR